MGFVASQVDKQRITTASFKTFTETSQASGSRLPSGSSLDADLIAFRVEVLTAFLASGTPLSHLEYFRPLLERVGGKSLTGEGHLGSFFLVSPLKTSNFSENHVAELIPFVVEEEKKKVREELQGPNIFVVWSQQSKLNTLDKTLLNTLSW